MNYKNIANLRRLRLWKGKEKENARWRKDDIQKGVAKCPQMHSNRSDLSQNGDRGYMKSTNKMLLTLMKYRSMIVV